MREVSIWNCEKAPVDGFFYSLKPQVTNVDTKLSHYCNDGIAIDDYYCQYYL